MADLFETDLTEDKTISRYFKETQSYKGASLKTYINIPLEISLNSNSESIWDITLDEIHEVEEGFRCERCGLLIQEIKRLAKPTGLCYDCDVDVFGSDA